MDISNVNELLQELSTAFWQKWDFWIATTFSVVSLIISWITYREAKEAKNAAFEAGKTVKIQTITIELTELTQKMVTLNANIDFTTARDLLSEVNRKIKRLTAPFKDEIDYKMSIELIEKTLDETKRALDQVKPLTNKIKIVDGSVYYAIESHFSNLSGQIAELMGHFEKRTIKK